MTGRTVEYFVFWTWIGNYLRTDTFLYIPWNAKVFYVIFKENLGEFCGLIDMWISLLQLSIALPTPGIGKYELSIYWSKVLRRRMAMNQ